MMTLEEARYRIASYKKDIKVLQSEIKHMEKFIREQNADPETLLLIRNKSIYRAKKNGISTKELGEKFRLSSTTINNICKRIDYYLLNKIDLYKYGDLQDLPKN